MIAAVLHLQEGAGVILKAIDAGRVYGFGVMEATGLPSGTVYPAMRRLERDSLIRSRWEKQSIADAEHRPARKYYSLTAAGKKRTLLLARESGEFLAKMLALVKPLIADNQEKRR